MFTVGNPLFLLSILHILTQSGGKTGPKSFIFAEDTQLVNSELSP